MGTMGKRSMGLSRESQGKITKYRNVESSTRVVADSANSRRARRFLSVMKLSVSAFRAQATAQRKILKPYQNQLNYGACSSFPAFGIKVDEVPPTMVDKTGVGTSRAQKSGVRSQSSENSTSSSEDEEEEDTTVEERGGATENNDGMESGSSRVGANNDPSAPSEKSSAGPRTKSNQRWMKLRTTVQLSGAISNTIQKSKPTLKREDSFLKRFSTRQIPETQETVDTGDETEATNGVQTQDEVNRRRRKRRKELSRTVVNPDENFYFYWLMTVTLCVLYNLWTLIVRQSFPELQSGWDTFWYACDSFTDVVFVCDIIVQFRTGYLEQGLMVYDSKKLAGHYLRSRAFLFDMISLLPLDLLQMELGINPMLRFPRFLKIYRVYNYYYIVESRTVYPNLWRVVNLIHILLILAHWFGCFYYLLSEAEGFRGAWVYPYRQGDDATLTRKYLGSLYWSTLTLTTIGDLPTPETNAEYIFTIVSYLIGVFIFATIVGQVGNVITNRNANRLEFERLLDGAKTYMRHHKVPGGMKRRVLRWYDYSWSRGRIQGGGDINTALGLLPDKLKTELALHVNLSVLKKVTIFQECQPEFLHDLVLKMKAYIFTPGDLICRKGEIAREMFIIADGILDVISDTGRVLTTMKAGDFFGEIGILNLDGLNKRTADVRSVGYSELFSLSREDVLTAMKDYPEAQEILQSLGRKRLMEAKNASKVHKAQGRKFRDHESSGDSDNAGKRIVEKLRSDVKGLKNALRRSRKGPSNEEDVEAPADNYQIKAFDKKQSILRRMSHVQSSDECESTNDVQTPIGVGLPLLQRLRLLKEKQEREKDEKGKIAVGFGNKETHAEPEFAKPDVPQAQQSSSPPPQERDHRADAGNDGPRICATIPQAELQSDLQVTKVDADSPGEVDETKADDEETRSSRDTRHRSLLAALGKHKLGSHREKSPEKCAQDSEMLGKSTTLQEEVNPETSIHVPKPNGNIVHSVPKEALGNKSEVPKTSIGSSTLGKSPDGAEAKGGKNLLWATIRGPYLSKSDTVLERQSSKEMIYDKRSRSMSPSDEVKDGEASRPRNVESSPVGRPGNRSPRQEAEEDVIAAVPGEQSTTHAKANRSAFRIKKYNSIDDLSPEFSALPFVKKLKILNERQKLAELVEQELVIRSASLDVPDSPRAVLESLIRSRSIASSIELQNYRKRRDCHEKANRTFCSLRPEDSFRAAMSDMQKRFVMMGSSASLQSPESNETLERRHLKSILKKLSCDGSVSDEDRYSRGCNSSLMRGRREDLRKLMRAPTIEGYAARHTKLTKSVTFDRETLPSPSDSVAVASNCFAEETKAKSSCSGRSPALCVVPVNRGTVQENVQLSSGAAATEDNVQPPALAGESEDEATAECDLSDEGSLPAVPYEKAMKIVQGHLDVIHMKLRSQFQMFEKEMRKRDDIIHKLRLKIEELEGLPVHVPQCGEPDESGRTKADPQSPTGEDPHKRRERRNAAAGTSSSISSAVRSRWFRFASTALSQSVSRRRIQHSKETSLFAPRLDHCDGGWNMGKICEKDGGGSQEGRISGGDVRPMCPTSDDSESVADAHQRRIEEMELSPIRDAATSSGTSKDFRDSKKDQNRRCDSRLRSGLLQRVTEFRRSMSRSSDFVALDIDSSHSSDPEDVHSNDWEIQMLAEEMSKKEKMQDWVEEDNRQMEEMKKLERDVNTLKQVVCESDLTSFSSSELDMLETILEAKDQRICEIASNSCFDVATRKESVEKEKDVIMSCAGGRRPPLRCKIGQAFSFDLHDMDDYDSKAFSRRKPPVPLRKQKTICCPFEERQSMDNILQATSLLANRVLGESRRLHKPRISSAKDCRSSLPLITSQTFASPKSTGASLPALSRNLPAIGSARGKECSTSSMHSTEDICRPMSGGPTDDSDSTLNESHQEGEKSPKFVAEEANKVQGKSADSSLNNFIKTVGQRVRHAVVGEVNPLKEQVPTISKLCEEQSVRGNESNERSGDFPVGAADGKDGADATDSFEAASQVDSPNL